MNKFFLLIMAFCASLCSGELYAQVEHDRVMTIEEIFSLADRNSKSIRSFITGIREAQEEVNVAKNARLPEIEASLSFSFLGNGCLIERNLSHGMKAPIPHLGNNFAIEASQAVYTGGAITHSIALAKLQEQSARLSLDVNRNQVRFILVGYYLDLFKQSNLLQVYEKNIELARQVLRDIQVKNSEGLVLKNDVTRYELLLANLELARIQIRNSLAILNANLLTTLGLPEEIRIQPDTSLVDRSLPVENKDYWMNRARMHAPLLKQGALSVEMSKHQYKFIKSERLPKLALVAGNHFDGPIIIEVPPINQNFNYWYIGVGLKYNISSLYKTNKSVRRSRFSMQRVTEQYDDVKEQTELAVKADYIKYLEAYEQLNTLLKSVELANQNYAVIHNRYKNDMALITDMLDASNAKLSAEVELINARIHIIFSYYKLLYVSGIL